MARAKMTISEKEEPQHQGVAVQWGPDQDADKLKGCVASPVLLRSCLLPEQACQTPKSWGSIWTSLPDSESGLEPGWFSPVELFETFRNRSK